ncbi:MAG: RsmD family RNA methyltransferase [Phycisphaeraceae bacterium]|nr:RsmD family RNA methyltransferase [Phycisphaeraceae bacterium]
MRIIGGTYRHRKIQGPVGDQTTRPITDRVKQSVFDRLAVLGVFEGPALDLFSGTGSMGLEALSRGCSHCTFIDRNRSARDILESNIKMLEAEDQVTVMGSDILVACGHRCLHMCLWMWCFVIHLMRWRVKRWTVLPSSLVFVIPLPTRGACSC